MQKTLDILEKNVQWIVLGLAGLFLIWTAYTYVLTPPATVKIGGHVVTPGEVAQAVQATAKDLDRQIKENKPVSFPTPDLVTDWQRHINNPYGVELAAASFGSLPDLQNGPKEGPGGPEGPHIAELPTAPAPQLLAAIVGLSTVIPQAPNPPQNQAPAVAQNVVAPQPKDTDWVTIPASIPAAEFCKALLAPFKGAQLNPALGTLYNTTLLQVVLERQQSNGVNGNGLPTFPAGNAGITEIEPLIADRQFIQKLPGESATMDARYQYITWAQQNQNLLVNPAFYQVVNGDLWQAPQLPAGPNDGTAPGAPAAVPAAATSPAAPAAPPAPEATPPPAKPNTAGMKYPNAFYAPLPPDPYHQPPPGFQFSPRQFDPRAGGRPFNPQPQMMNGNPGNGIINPFNLPSDILFWAIDETAKPGQTYRYRVKYVIKNPVFAVQGMAPAKLTGQLAIDSAPSAWSDPIKVPAMTKFWVANAQGRDQATLDVFQYKNGDWKATKSKLAPGDEIPGTDLTMVDVRADEAGHGREKYVLLTSADGDMLRRDVTKDESDPDHQSMLNPNGPNGVNAPPPPPGPASINPRGGFRSPPGRFSPRPH